MHQSIAYDPVFSKNLLGPCANVVLQICVVSDIVEWTAHVIAMETKKHSFVSILSESESLNFSIFADILLCFGLSVATFFILQEFKKVVVRIGYVICQ